MERNDWEEMMAKLRKAQTLIQDVRVGLEGLPGAVPDDEFVELIRERAGGDMRNRDRWVFVKVDSNDAVAFKTYEALRENAVQKFEVLGRGAKARAARDCGLSSPAVTAVLKGNITVPDNLEKLLDWLEQQGSEWPNW